MPNKRERGSSIGLEEKRKRGAETKSRNREGKTERKKNVFALFGAVFLQPCHERLVLRVVFVLAAAVAACICRPLRLFWGFGCADRER